MTTILIVDDRPTNREVLITLLGYKGYRLLEASDGAEALAVAQAERPDLVITDILMPSMGGYEEAIAAPKSPPDLFDLPGGQETILLVEDEEAVRSLSCQVLELSGYTVVEAFHGGEALLLNEQHPDPH